ncbi:hypothetical protein [Phenylobacterium sp.]|uniref:hypothetical protein n=1 Tax=Phenylobacterium sp. TaxID=1871053 RepID=UPI0025E325D2|nr:hypothetical protein [Phenylobacterium sp.]
MVQPTVYVLPAAPLFVCSPVLPVQAANSVIAAPASNVRRFQSALAIRNPY